MPGFAVAHGLRPVISVLALLCLLPACVPTSPQLSTAAGLERFAARPATSPVFESSVNQARVALGLRLFFEPRLSAGNQMSCASCHQPGRGFSNGEPNAAGVNGQRGTRNTPTLYGVSHYQTLFWDGRSPDLEDQALAPIQNPLEMNESLPRVVLKLSELPYYRVKFQQIFGTAITAAGIAEALASFERALQLKPSAYDRYLEGQLDALTPEQERGMILFGRQAHCATCHKGLKMTDNKFHNLGVGMHQPQPDLGRFAVTRQPEDTGAFRTPSLRNIAQTGPYMHDGSLRTLEDVIEFYDRGGFPNPYLSHEMNPLDLSTQDKQDLLAFLRVLNSPDNLRELAALPGVQLPGEPLPEGLARLR